MGGNMGCTAHSQAYLLCSRAGSNITSYKKRVSLYLQSVLMLYIPTVRKVVNCHVVTKERRDHFSSLNHRDFAN